ncbi:Urease [Massospora cicadina]|nr:Urease [Massospora cicadina]
MRLIPRELDKLVVTQVGTLAQRRLHRGLKLNRVETVGLISSVLLELARDGNYSVADLMAKGKEILGRRHVLDGVPEAIHDIQLEATFPDGTFLITVHEPVSSRDGDFELALYGSCLTVPTNCDALFPVEEVAAPKDETEPVLGNEGTGQIVPDCEPQLPTHSEVGPFLLARDPIALCPGRRRIKLTISNTGDRPIQVGSHFHFIETNPKLRFDRRRAYGMRLDIPSGTSIRFEPGDARLVQLVEIGGGPLDPGRVDGLIDALVAKGFGHTIEEVDGMEECCPRQLDRAAYCSMYGPTVGDRVRLGDTNLVIEVEADMTVYGDECKFGGGKVLREGMGQATGFNGADVLDLLITNALIIDYSGIYKADIGIKAGHIAVIGKGGNPAMMDGVLAAEGLIVTAGAVDAHVHFICPQICEAALAGGITTLVGGGTGPATGTNATTCTPGPANLHAMFRSTDAIPLNLGFTGKGNSASMVGLEDQIVAGAVGLKLHEDWGTTPAAIDACLRVCDKYDVQATVHTDTLNESGYVEQTIAAIAGRTIHTYHTEGAGVCAHPYVLPSSTNPTRPYTINTLDEHVDMLMVCHHLDNRIPEDVAFAESRIRYETIAAEDVLHDLGALHGPHRRGCFAHVEDRPQDEGPARPPRPGLGGHPDLADNFRVRRYVAKYTINPALAHGMAHLVGSVEVGKLADLVIYRPGYFGAKPEYVIIYAQMGDANASIPTTQPLIFRPMFSSPQTNSILFTSQAAVDANSLAPLNLTKRIEPVLHCRSINKSQLKLNTLCPAIDVDPETYQVTLGGELCTSEPAGKALPPHPNPYDQRHLT